MGGGRAPGRQSRRATCRAGLHDGWQLGVPDVVVSMPVPFGVPADGPDVFRNFVLPDSAERAALRARARIPPGQCARASPRAHPARRHRRRPASRRERLRRRASPGMDVPGARFPDGHFLGWAPGKAPWRGGVSVADRTGHRLRRPDAPEAERPSRDGSRVDRLVSHRRGAAADAAHAAARLEDDRHSGGREPLRNHRSLRRAGRRDGAERLSARALPREGDVRARDDAQREIGDAAPHPELEFQLAGRVSVRAAGRTASRHDDRDALPLRQLGRQSAQPQLAAAPRRFRIRDDRRDGRAARAGADEERG